MTSAYPVRLVQFPWGLVPLHRRRRRTVLTPRSAAYYTRHPVTGILVAFFTLAFALVPFAFAAVIGAGWLVWVMIVSAGWALALPFQGRQRNAR